MMDKNSVEAAAERVLAMEEEIESAGTAATHGEALEYSRAQLHKWVDTVIGAVASPGVGRVTLIHENGSQSKIASPELPFLLSIPITFSKRDEE